MSLYGDSEREKRMRAGFFYHLKHGDIDVPYMRGKSRGSKKLGQSWAIDEIPGTFRAVIGTNVDYAPLVQDRDEQASYHAQTGWVTAQGVVEMNKAAVNENIRRAIEDEIKKGL
jgi:hypothetical protein